jgi:4a-hydroxytetrahydrobiopterin dehydratase
MRKFTKILENLSSDKIYQIDATLKLVVKADSEGEAGYLADSILGGIEEQTDFTIQNISEISDDEFSNQYESVSSNWREVKNKLQKTFQFKDFKEALDFINKIGDISESMNHHPEIINVYNKVTIKLQTHEENKITELDKKLAKRIDNIFNI